VESSTTAGREPPSSPWRWVKPAVTVVIFAALAWGLRQLLTSFSYDEVIAGLDAMAPARIAAAAAVVAVVHALYIVRERLAVDFAGASSLAWRKVAIASLIARSLSTLGIATITGLALRVRIYQDYRLDGAAVARITIYNESTFYVGVGRGDRAACSTATALPPPMVGTSVHSAVAGAGSVRRRWWRWWPTCTSGTCVGADAAARSARFELPVLTPVQLGAQVVLPVVDTLPRWVDHAPRWCRRRPASATASSWSRSAWSPT
jgi:hypothetical protein